MKIEHIAMYVNELETARDFFVKYLGGESNDGYHNEKTGFRSFFIRFEDGARLEIMNKKQALCVRNQETIVGVLLFSRSRNMICCLAVDPDHRKQGLASILLKKALDELDRSKEITVSTFRENDDKGIAPRALYRKFGFQEGELTEEFGYPNQVFVLYP